MQVTVHTRLGTTSSEKSVQNQYLRLGITAQGKKKKAVIMFSSLYLQNKQIGRQLIYNVTNRRG